MSDIYKKQVGGTHYQSMVIQPSEFINKNNIPFAEGNAIKYLCRHKQKNYIKLLLKSGDNLTTDSKVELSTIHGAKGRECKNVILYVDFGSEDENDFLAREADKDADKIHRLFFVGVTRAKQNLYIMESTQTNFYNIGYPIV